MGLFEGINNPWAPGGQMSPQMPWAQSGLNYGWGHGNEFFAPKTKQQIALEGYLQMAVIAAVVVAPLVLGAQAAAAGASTAGMGASAEAAGAVVAQGAGATAVGAGLSASTSIAVATGLGASALLQPFLQQKSAAALQIAAAMGEVELNRTLHQLSESGTQKVETQVDLPLHDSVPILVGIVEELHRQPLAILELKSLKKGMAPSRHIVKLVFDVFSKQLDVWEPTLDYSLKNDLSPCLQGEGRCWTFELSPDQRRNLEAVILCEADDTAEQIGLVAWAYLNMIQKFGFEKGMKRSTAYRYSTPAYKFWMTLLGDKQYEKDKPPRNWMGISNKATNRLAVDSHNTSVESKANDIWNVVNDRLNDRSKNPISGWIGQGNRDDLNRDDVDLDNDGKLDEKGEQKWPHARRYYLLQSSENLRPIRVKYLKGKNPIGDTFIFDEEGIEEYFRLHPEKYNPPVPKLEYEQ